MACSDWGPACARYQVGGWLRSSTFKPSELRWEQAQNAKSLAESLAIEEVSPVRVLLLCRPEPTLLLC